jgi:hypothetical protein
MDLIGSNMSFLVGQSSIPSDGILPSYARLSHSYVPTSQGLSSGGKAPLHGSRHFVNPDPLFHRDYETEKSKFYNVSRSKVENYKILCQLASLEF